MCYGYGFSEGFGFLWTLIICIIVILGLCYGAYRVFKCNKIGYNNVKKENTKALEILNERYSKGEISDEEYNFKKIQILR